jgi:hypothetical protein
LAFAEQAMNFEFLLTATDGKIFKIMADMTDKLLSKRMDIVMPQGKYHMYHGSGMSFMAKLYSGIYLFLAGKGVGENCKQG